MFFSFFHILNIRFDFRAREFVDRRRSYGRWQHAIVFSRDQRLRTWCQINIPELLYLHHRNDGNLVHRGYFKSVPGLRDQTRE